MTHHNHKERHNPRYDAVINSISEYNSSDCLTILEVGIEPFIFTEMLVENFPDAEISGIGYGGETPDSHNINGKEIQVYYCNIEEDKWSFDDEKFDVVTMMAILEHLFDPVAALVEAHRVLRDSGKCLITTPNAVNLQRRIETLLGQNPFDGFPLESRYNRHQHEYTTAELEDLLPRTGLIPTKIEMLTETRNSGTAKLMEFVTNLYPSIRDQIFVEAEKGKPEGGLPQVYRQGLVEDRETHPLLDGQ